jgi:hypothetical protein
MDAKRSQRLAQRCLVRAARVPARGVGRCTASWCRWPGDGSATGPAARRGTDYVVNDVAVLLHGTGLAVAALRLAQHREWPPRELVEPVENVVGGLRMCVGLLLLLVVALTLLAALLYGGAIDGCTLRPRCGQREEAFAVDREHGWQAQ